MSGSHAFFASISDIKKAARRTDKMDLVASALRCSGVLRGRFGFSLAGSRSDSIAAFQAAPKGALLKRSGKGKAAAAGDGDPRQTDIEQAATDPTERDAAGADANVVNFMSRTTNERLADAGSPTSLEGA